MSLGFEQAGFDVLAAVEYDAIHAAVHKFNFPRTEIVCADASAITAKKVKNAIERGWQKHREGGWREPLDVVIGGPPCQGFSVIGRRAFDDPRNQLVFDFARFVGALKPRYFVMENVPGLTSVMAGEREGATKLLDLLLEEFDAFGYDVLAPQVLNACEFGVPQDRPRLILVGSRRGEKEPRYPTAQTRGRSRRGETDAADGDAAEADGFCPTVWDAIGDLPDLDDFDQLLQSDEVRLPDRAATALNEAAGSYARLLRGLDPDPEDYSWPRTWDQAVLTSSLRTLHDPGVAKRFDATEQGRPEPVSRLFRLHPEGVSSTLRAGTHYERGSFNAPRPIHPSLPRVLSVREAARLHSFPDWFRLHWTKWHGFRQVGNSLPPLVGRAVGAEIMRALNIEPCKPTEAIELGPRELLYLENVAAAKRFGADLSRAPRNALRTRRRDRDTSQTPEPTSTTAVSAVA